MKKVQNPYCPYCNTEFQTVCHLFVTHSIAIRFWNNFTERYQSISKSNLSLSESEILYGVQKGFSSCLTLNHLIFIELKTELKNFI